MFPIVEKEQLAATITRYVIKAPFIARKRKAGNFVMLRIDNRGERIPLTIADGDPVKGTITLIVQSIGKTTKQLSTLNVGDGILDLVGPLGNPTPLDHHGNIICIGGGVGTAELYPIAKALREAGNNVYTIVGARSSDLVILVPEMKECSNAVYVTTDDGSVGRKGFVTDQLRELLESSEHFDAVYAIGPLPMMKAVSEVTRATKVPTVVSLNTIMVDGTGMCGGCRVTVGGTMRFACVDGPEFDGHQVDFDELMIRNRSYFDAERTSEERWHTCRLTGEVRPS